MPTAYQVDVLHRLVRSRAWGTLTDDESHDHYRRLAAEPEFEPTFGQLCDLRDVAELSMSAGAIQSLARSAVFAAGAKRAFVAPTDAHYGLARMLQAFCEIEGTVVGVFRTLAEAEEWLGLSPGTPPGEAPAP